MCLLVLALSNSYPLTSLRHGQLLAITEMIHDRNELIREYSSDIEIAVFKASVIVSRSFS